MKAIFKKIKIYELAMLVAVVHLIFIIIIQSENYIFYISSLSSQENLLSYIGELGFDNIVFSVFLGALAFFLTSHFLSKVIYFFLVILINFYLVLDQVAFKIFFDHLKLGLLEGFSGLDVLISSTLAEIDVVFYFNLAYWFLSSILLFYAIFFSNYFRLKMFSLSKATVLPGATLFLCLGIVLFSIDNTGATLNQHSMTSLLGSNGQRSTVDLLEKNQEGVDFYQSKYDVIEEPSVILKKINEIELKVKDNVDKPNIVLIVLESVGSQQLLTDEGLPSRIITPAIRKLAENSVIFDSMYSVYPATVLSHVSMSTGGPAITLGNVYKDLSYTYQGPTLNKGLSALGYQTGLFSSQKLNYGNMAGFYKKLGFDKYFDFGEASEAFQGQHKLHSWGGEESAIVDQAIAWLDEIKNSEEPFFLQYLSNATHHPYSVPAGFDGVVDDDSKSMDYKNALNYTDQVIDKLIQYLKNNGLLENTLIAITGDHGEAFGVKHEKNFTHKNYLYEENVKNFLMLSYSSLVAEPVVSHRIATIGDVMPTLLSFAKAPQIFLPAQNLLSKKYEPRIAFFHKNSPPILWGLRDGKWKYIDTRLNSKAQLYDLNIDPNEKVNLAALYPEKITEYRSLVSQWYVSSNNSFLSKLRAYDSGDVILPTKEQLQNPGPIGIVIGYREGNRFVKARSLLSSRKISAWISWIAFPEETSLMFKWKSPTGREYEKKQVMFPGWADTIDKMPVVESLEVGEWEFSIYNNEQLLMTKLFIIESDS